jgi:hypothetical protein
METSETQREIEQAIRILCDDTWPFATASDIAESTTLTKKTVLNNIDAVRRRNPEIKARTVGQANVYYVDNNKLDEIVGDETYDAREIAQFDGLAVYVEIRPAPENSVYDLEAHWYDSDANEIEGYYPSVEEMGLAVDLVVPSPDSIRMYDPDKIESEQVEDNSE